MTVLAKQSDHDILTFRQIPTLLGAPTADIEDVRPGDICMVGLFEDHADSEGFGARFAARQIRYAGAVDDVELTGIGLPRVLDLGDLNVFPVERERNDRALLRQVGAMLEAGAVPIVVGGCFTLAPLIQVCLQQACRCGVFLMELPALDRNRMPTGSASTVVLTINLAALHSSTTRAERPLALLKDQISALPPHSVRLVHLTGLSPDLDLSGRHEAALGQHVLAFTVAHLRKAGDQCR